VSSTSRSIATRSAIHPLGDPPGRGQLRARLQRALRHEREQHPLDHHRVTAAPGAHLPQRSADPEPLPQPIQHPRPTQAAGVENLDLPAGRRGRGEGLLRGQEP